MKREISAGVIIYYREPETQKIYYLVLHYGAGHWDFAKGKLEAGETALQAAIREVQEETGLTVQTEPGFEQMYTYYFKDRSGNLVTKEVTFFIAEVQPTVEVILSHEHIFYKWLPFEDARKQLTFNNTRQLLSMADQLIHAREHENT